MKHCLECLIYYLINHEGVIILSTGETPGEIFAANAHRSYFMSFAYFYLYHALEKNSQWKLFTITTLEKSKPEKSPYVKKTKKTVSKKKETSSDHFVKQRKKKPCRKRQRLLACPSCSSADHFPPLTLTARVLPLPLFLASLPIPELNCTEREKKKKKNVLQCDAFPGKS